MGELSYRISDPTFTIYERAALGGLAATIRAWQRLPNRYPPPDGITADFDASTVTLRWGDGITDHEALRRLLAASFRLTDDGLIDLPGLQIEEDQRELRLAVHDGISLTFLQHPRKRPGPKELGRLKVRDVDDDVDRVFSYKKVERYAHQTAQGTGLLSRPKRGSEAQRFPAVASVLQSCVPGAMEGACQLSAPASRVILLHFLVVGAPVFLLRSWTRNERTQRCIVVPDVVDLVRFARAVGRLSDRRVRRFTNSYLGRVVGGAEEAALRFLVDYRHAAEAAGGESIAGCLVIAMGKVPWDPNQTNRSLTRRLRGTYPELAVFEAASTHLGRSKIITTKRGEPFAIPGSRVPELVAANLASDRHWGAHFKALMSTEQDARTLHFQGKGLSAMKNAITDADDKAIIEAFQEAWERTMGALGERARRDHLDFARLVDVERERIRNGILRTRTADALASWFLRLCAEATGGASLSTVRTQAERLRRFIFNPRSFDRFQNLLLFALVSYEGKSQKPANA